MCNFQTLFNGWFVENVLWNCSHVNITRTNARLYDPLQGHQGQWVNYQNATINASADFNLFSSLDPTKQCLIAVYFKETLSFIYILYNVPVSHWMSSPFSSGERLVFHQYVPLVSWNMHMGLLQVMPFLILLPVDVTHNLQGYFSDINTIYDCPSTRLTTMKDVAK